MNFQDKKLTCKVCEKPFIYTAKEQQFFQTKGFLKGDRVRCRDCAKKKKKQPKLSAAGGRPTVGGHLACFAFLQGNCTRGSACKFAHGEVDGILGGSDEGDVVREDEEEYAASKDDSKLAAVEVPMDPQEAKRRRREEKQAKKAQKRAKPDLGEAGAGALQRKALERQREQARAVPDRSSDED
jgi:hypothetical protein